MLGLGTETLRKDDTQETAAGSSPSLLSKASGLVLQALALLES